MWQDYGEQKLRGRGERYEEENITKGKRENKDEYERKQSIYRQGEAPSHTQVKAALLPGVGLAVVLSGYNILEQFTSSNPVVKHTHTHIY